MFKFMLLLFSEAPPGESIGSMQWRWSKVPEEVPSKFARKEPGHWTFHC